MSLSFCLERMNTTVGVQCVWFVSRFVVCTWWWWWWWWRQRWCCFWCWCHAAVAVIALNVLNAAVAAVLFFFSVQKLSGICSNLLSGVRFASLEAVLNTNPRQARFREILVAARVAWPMGQRAGVAGPAKGSPAPRNTHPTRIFQNGAPQNGGVSRLDSL